MLLFFLKQRVRQLVDMGIFAWGRDFAGGKGGILLGGGGGEGKFQGPPSLCMKPSIYINKYIYIHIHTHRIYAI